MDDYYYIIGRIVDTLQKWNKVRIFFPIIYQHKEGGIRIEQALAMGVDELRRVDRVYCNNGANVHLVLLKAVCQQHFFEAKG